MSAAENQSDEALAAGVRSGDPAAMRALFDAYFPLLADYASAMLRSTEAAEDVVADVFARILERHATFVPRHSVRAYLLWLVRHRALNALRSDYREQRRYAMLARRGDASVVPEDVPSPDGGILDAEEDERKNRDLLSAVAELSPTARTIVLLRLRRELDYDEIAAILDMSRDAVKMQLSRALRALRERLGSG